VPTEIRIYFEGDKRLRVGFHAFFRELRVQARRYRWDFNLISGRSGETAYRDFIKAAKSHRNAWNILLRDSEGPDFDNRDDSIFWMVQMMEAWFHADKEALKSFYGPSFKTKALKKNLNVEEISKADLEKGLSSATRETRKGDYLENKTWHGPELLRAIDPDKVRKAAPNCERLFTAILTKLAEPD